MIERVQRRMLAKDDEGDACPGEPAGERKLPVNRPGPETHNHATRTFGRQFVKPRIPAPVRMNAQKVHFVLVCAVR